MAYNLWRTAKSGKFVPETEAQAAPLSAQIQHTEETGNAVLLRHRWLESTQIYVAANDRQVAADYYAACLKLESWS